MENKELEIMEPYKGLRPYEEENRDIFFGRDRERDILIDKLISNKLTLLFAATGVGKSSLLQAAVMPELKRPERRGLDVVYYNDWVVDPRQELKNKTIEVLRERRKLGFDYRVEMDIPLKDFFQICATFSSEPLIVILDQFEEFFQYRRFQEDFLHFIEEFSQCIRDRKTPVVFLISMREDFALELNAFKNYLPTTLFENYFRLEKLEEDKAREAVCNPVEKLGFQYQPELLTGLVKDLAEREKQTRVGASPAAFVKDMPAYVEPPYLQIVCTQLWEQEKSNPGKTIRLETYDKKGRAKGYTDSYFKSVMDKFSLDEKKIASKAFNHLVTPRGTKMAYPVKDLANLLRVEEKGLENVLEKLRKARILRSHKREGVIWYELYHDIFSGIIYQWNEKFKTRQRIKRASFISAIAIVAGLMLFFIYDILINSSSHYLRLHLNREISDTIEVYRGNLKTPDILNLHKFQAETVYQRNRVEPDKVFIEKQIGDIDNLDLELIGHLPIADRVSAYWQAGETDKALKLADQSISGDDMHLSRQIIDRLAEFHSLESYKILKKHLAPNENIYIRKKVAEAMSTMESSLIEDDFIKLLKDKAIALRKVASMAFIRIGSEKLLPHLILMVKDEDSEVRKNIVEALGQIGSEKVLDPLIDALNDHYPDVRVSAAKALENIRDEKSVDALIDALKDKDMDVRRNAFNSLVNLVEENSVDSLINVLKDKDMEPDVRGSAADALVIIDSEKVVATLIDALKDKDSKVRITATQALGKIRSPKVINTLKNLLKDQNSDVRLNASFSLYGLGYYNSESIRLLLSNLYRLSLSRREIIDLKCPVEDYFKKEKLIKILSVLLEDKNSMVRMEAAKLLCNIGGKQAVNQLIGMLKDQNPEVRNSAAEALEKIGSPQVVTHFMDLLNDVDPEIQFRTACSLLQLGINNEVKIWKIISKKVEIERSFYGDTLNIDLNPINIERGLEPLLTLLKDQDWEVRRGAIILSGKIKNEKVINQLIEFLKDKNFEVRFMAAEALGEIGSARGVNPLIELFDDRFLPIRLRAALSIGKIGSVKGVTPIINLLKDNNSLTRDVVANALGMIGDPRAVKPLSDLIKDQNKSIRSATAEALGKIGSAGTFAPLSELLKDPDKDVRLKAVEALGKISSEKAVDSLIATLKDHDDDVRIYAASKLGEIGSKRAVEPLIDMMNDPDSLVQYSSAAALIRIGNKKAICEIFRINKKLKGIKLGALTSEAENRIGGIKAITSLDNFLYCPNEYMLEYEANVIGSAKATEQLIELLKDPDDYTRRLTAEALGKIGSEKAVDSLIEALSDQDSDVRKSAAEALGQIGSKKAVLSLIERVKDPAEDVQEEAVKALFKFPTIKDIVPLTKLLNDKYFEDNVRGLIIIYFGKFSHKEKMGIIKNIYKNPGESLYIRRAAAVFLLKFEDKEAMDYLKKKSKSDNINERIKVAEILGEIPSKSGTHLLIEMINDDYPDVKKQVISSLGNSEEKTVVNILHPLLNDQHPNIREPVVEALANIASSDSIEPLKKIALSAEERISTRKKAINAIIKIRKENPIKIYMELLDYDDEIIQSTALKAIRKIKSPQNLEPGLAKELKKKLKEQLKQLEDRKKKWRHIRDEDTESYNDQEMETWRKRLEDVKPREYMEFHVAYALSRMDPENEGIKLLGHHLANVREGALIGFGIYHDVSLLEKLYWKRKESDKPWFRHAAYRAIDDILLNIEAFGEKKEFDELKSLFKQLQEKEGKKLHTGVKTRIEWTIDRLRERGSGR